MRTVAGWALASSAGSPRKPQTAASLRQGSCGAAHRSKEGKGFHCAELPLVLWKEELMYNLNA